MNRKPLASLKVGDRAAALDWSPIVKVTHGDAGNNWGADFTGPSKADPIVTYVTEARRSYTYRTRNRAETTVLDDDEPTHDYLPTEAEWYALKHTANLLDTMKVALERFVEPAQLGRTAHHIRALMARLDPITYHAQEDSNEPME